MWSGDPMAVESIRGGGVGGAPPPRTGCSDGNVPHSAPLCNTIAVIRPTTGQARPNPDAFGLQTGGLRRGTSAWVYPPSRRTTACKTRRRMTDCSPVGPSLASSRMRRAVLTALPCLVLALLLAACGSGGASAGGDPATAAPAGAAIYLGGVVRPEGDQRDDVLDAARKVMRTDA